MRSASRVYFVGNGRCYHTIDWCRAIYPCLPQDSWSFLTDCVESEGHLRIIGEGDQPISLFNIDSLLMQKQSRMANRWRNFVKLLLLPIQALKLRAVLQRPKGKVIHAHTFYYGLMCRLARLPYLFTPQGGELTERPKESTVYRKLMGWVLNGAAYSFVDSERMRSMAIELGCVRVGIYQYGVDTSACRRSDMSNKRWRIVSNRGIEANYQIDRIQFGRDRQQTRERLTFVYPFWEATYLKAFRARLRIGDEDLGRISKDRCYQLYAESRLVISIPQTDSSPRSVYEAIFCGAAVATTGSRWIDDLPLSMRNRIRVVDPEEEGWLSDAVNWADKLSNAPFVPCEDAISRYDQYAVARTIYERFYRPTLDGNGEFL